MSAKIMYFSVYTRISVFLRLKLRYDIASPYCGSEHRDTHHHENEAHYIVEVVPTPNDITIKLLPASQLPYNARIPRI